MHWILRLVLITATLSLSTLGRAASQTIGFKPPFSPQYNWLTMAFALVSLIIIALISLKKFKPGFSVPSECRLIEKKYLSNKTIIYILEYQKQRFLLADNHQSITIHALTSDFPIQLKTEPMPGKPTI